VLPEGGAADAIVNETDSGVDLLIRPHRRLELSLERREALVALAEQADLARLSWGDRAAAEPIVVRRPPLVVFGEVRPSAARRLPGSDRRAEWRCAAVTAWTGDALRPPICSPVGGRGRWPRRQARLAGERQVGDRRRRGGTPLAGAGDGRAPRSLSQSAANRPPRRLDAVLLDPPRAGARRSRPSSPARRWRG
jgi:23S rRNA (uracil1939-C5)-methyltransferase